MYFYVLKIISAFLGGCFNWIKKKYILCHCESKPTYYTFLSQALQITVITILFNDKNIFSSISLESVKSLV